MNVDLTPDQRALVKRAIDGGRFSHEEEAVQEGFGAVAAFLALAIVGVANPNTQTVCSVYTIRPTAQSDDAIRGATGAD